MRVAAAAGRRGTVFSRSSAGGPFRLTWGQMCVDARRGCSRPTRASLPATATAGQRETVCRDRNCGPFQLTPGRFVFLDVRNALAPVAAAAGKREQICPDLRALGRSQREGLSGSSNPEVLQATPKESLGPTRNEFLGPPRGSFSIGSSSLRLGMRWRPSRLQQANPKQFVETFGPTDLSNRPPIGSPSLRSEMR